MNNKTFDLEAVTTRQLKRQPLGVSFSYSRKINFRVFSLLCVFLIVIVTLTLNKICMYVYKNILLDLKAPGIIQ